MILKRHNYFQNENNEKVTHIFPPRHLILKLQQEILKLNAMTMRELQLPKTELMAIFLRLENRSLSKYLTFLYLVTYLFLILTFFRFTQ